MWIRIERETNQSVLFSDTKLTSCDKNMIGLLIERILVDMNLYYHHDDEMKNKFVLGMKNIILKICYSCLLSDNLRKVFSFQLNIHKANQISHFTPNYS